MDYIQCKVVLEADAELIWSFFTEPEHIMQWFSTDDWTVEKVENDVCLHCTFSFDLKSKVSGEELKYTGEYIGIDPTKKIRYQVEDGRHVDVYFTKKHGKIILMQKFLPDPLQAVEYQQNQWNKLFHNFKTYVDQKKQS